MENAWTTIEVESRVRDPRVISHRRGGILVRARFVVPLALATVSRYKTEGSGGRERGEGVNVRPVGWLVHSKRAERSYRGEIFRKSIRSPDASRCSFSNFSFHG